MVRRVLLLKKYLYKRHALRAQLQALALVRGLRTCGCRVGLHKGFSLRSSVRFFALERLQAIVLSVCCNCCELV